MNHSNSKAVKRTWRPIRKGAFMVGLAMAAGACERGDVKEGVPPPTPTTPEPTEEATSGPVRDVDAIVGATDRSAYVDRQVELTSAQIQRVASEQVYWVGAAADRAVPVYLDDETRRSLPADQQRFNMGDRVTIMGEIRRSPSLEDLQSKWNLMAQDAEQIRNAQVYIHATRLLRVVEAVPGQPPAEPGDQPGERPGQPQPGQPGDYRPGQPGQPQPGQRRDYRPSQPDQRQPGPSGEFQLNKYE